MLAPQGQSNSSWYFMTPGWKPYIEKKEENVKDSEKDTEMALVVVVGGSRDITSKKGDMDFLPGPKEYHFWLWYDYFW